MTSLSRLILDPRHPAVRADLADVDSLHKTLMRLIPDHIGPTPEPGPASCSAPNPDPIPSSSSKLPTRPTSPPCPPTTAPAAPSTSPLC